jgi:F1F0 ATPase subunit 2
MVTSEPGTLVLVLLAGGALGALFFGGLWWTVLRGAASDKPARWFFASMLLRVGLTLAGFYALAGGQPDRLGLCLLGFIIARMVVTRLTQPPSDRAARPAKEAGNAP